jgi:hypothetical protein
MATYWQVTVKHNGEHLFATQKHDGFTWCENKALDMMRLVRRRFPAAEGYTVILSEMDPAPAVVRTILGEEEK